MIAALVSAIVLIFGMGIGYFIRHLVQKEEIANKPPDNREAVTIISQLYQVADGMRGYFRRVAHPRDLLDSANFNRGVELMRRPDVPVEKLLEYGGGDNGILSCIALRALAFRQLERQDILQIIDYLEFFGSWQVYLALDLLAASETPVLGEFLAKARAWWISNPAVSPVVLDTIRLRLEKGDPATFGDSLASRDEELLNEIEICLETWGDPLVGPFHEELINHRISLLDEAYLRTVGRVWAKANFDDSIIPHENLDTLVEKISDSLLKPPKRSVLLVGEAGSGKSVVLKTLFRRLETEQWRIFEASAVDILAGQVYIGELEGRLQKLMQKLDSRKRVLWYVPDFHQLMFAGRHRFSQTSVLEMILPYVERSKIKIIGETHPAANEKLSVDNPRVHSSLDVFKLEPLGEADTLAITKKWAQTQIKDGETKISDRLFRETLHVARQFLNNMAMPGNVFQLLKLVQRQLLIEGRAFHEIKTDDLYKALSRLTGLPRIILDDQKGLSIDELRDLFHKRVLGQSEAVDCLVERVAMIKAGLTDPSRPFGVFLFAGPTGTGKTEIGKTLAEFLFGSPERLIRLDMSEFQTADAIDRILGQAGTEYTTPSLASKIRKEPFSVVLLDEFEKASPNIYDLFLQVFDDGRLTDRHGNVVDFRHAIFILTSNLGATIHIGAGIGFEKSSDGFSPTGVQKAISLTFRPEFINRLDRVVIFRPLDRTTMRRILYNELEFALQRRGLRTREWAVEWEESAINFLLEKGFTPELGARPLKRAIEQYLLAPLALTIAGRQFPEGDQFLFVRSDGEQIQVEFIDPDAGEVEEAEPAAEPHVEKLTLRTILLEPKRTGAELDYLEKNYADLLNYISAPDWENRKNELLTGMSAKDFWDRPERFKTLGDVEIMDRIETGLNTAESLIGRIKNNALPKNLIARLAQQLYLLSEAYSSYTADMPQDAFVKIETKPTSAAAAVANDFAAGLKSMYVNWAQKRQMRFEVLEEQVESQHGYACLLAVSGYAAYRILSLEAGLHVLEMAKQDHKVARHNIKVLVAPQPDAPDGGNLAAVARRVFADYTTTNKIVRRYQIEPTPLVRDNVRKWRTGRLDRVLDGDFDVLG